MSEIIKKFAEYNKGREITKQEGNFSLFVWGSFPMGCYSPYTDKYYKQDFGPIVFLIKGDFGAGFFSLEDYKQPTRETFDKYLKIDSNDSLDEVSDFYNFKKETIEIYDYLKPDILPKIKTELLVENIIKIFTLFFKLQVTTLFSEALDEKLIKEFNQSLGGNDRGFADFLKTSSLLTFRSFASRNDEALLNFGNTPTYNIQWILANYLMTVSLAESEIQIKKLVEDRGGKDKIFADLNNLDNQIKSNKEKVEKFRETLRGDILKLFDFNQLCMYIRDFRKDEVLKGITALSNCLRELFLRLGLKESDIVYSFYPDFLDSTYQESNYKNIIENRKKGFLVDFDKDGIKTEYGDGNELLSELYKVMDNSFVAHKEDIIQGNVGCKGKAQAEICVVLDRKDFDKFKDGNILVTSMTRPEFVPLMKKASAVITDEGGITCHAAIISRELGIPCIIGTRNATRVLKDGDLVEVDADLGVVKIINEVQDIK